MNYHLEFVRSHFDKFEQIKVQTYHSVYNCNNYKKTENKLKQLGENYPLECILFSCSDVKNDIALDIAVKLPDEPGIYKDIQPNSRDC